MGTASAMGMGTASAATASAVGTGAASAAAASAVSGKLQAGYARVLFVEYIERRQADVRDFLLTEHDFVSHFGVWRYAGGAAR
jgi:hypothetical protein